MAEVLAIAPRVLTRLVAGSLQELASIRITTCSSRRALARKLRGGQFQLAVADWQTSGREGVALLAHLGIPVILVSDPQHLAEAYRLAKTVEIVLETPLNRQEVAALVSALLQGEKLPQAAPAPEQKPASVAKGAGR